CYVEESVIRRSYSISITINGLLAETFVACAVMSCGVDDVNEGAEEPPALRSISDIYDEYGLVDTTGHAPYKDEQTAEYERLLNDIVDELNDKLDQLDDKDEEIKRLQKEVERLSVENVKQSKSQAKKSATDTDDNRVAKDDSGTAESPSGKAVGTFEMTYYGMDCAGCSGTTASGLKLSQGQTSYKGMRVLAADTSVLPLHTTVKVTNNDGTSYVGIVKDRGGAIKG